MTDVFKFVVGQSYKDTGCARKNSNDQFISRFCAPDEKAIQNAGGIRFRKSISEQLEHNGYQIPAYFVLMTNKNAAFDVPWSDQFDPKRPEKLVYFGDAKPPSQSARAHKGNRAVLNAWSRQSSLLHDGPFKMPFLYFFKSGQGSVIFNGLFRLEEVSFVDDEHEGRPFENIKMVLTNENVNFVDPNWLNQRAVASDLDEADSLAPIGSSWSKSTKIPDWTLDPNVMRRVAKLSGGPDAEISPGLREVFQNALDVSPPISGDNHGNK